MRDYTNKLFVAMEDGSIAASYVAATCLHYMSEDDVKDMCQANDIFNDENDDFDDENDDFVDEDEDGPYFFENEEDERSFDEPGYRTVTARPDAEYDRDPDRNDYRSSGWEDDGDWD